MQRYHTPLTFTATATDSETGFDAANVEARSIVRQWRTPDLLGDTLTLTFTTATPACVFVMGTNAPTLTFGGSALTGTPAETPLAYPDGINAALLATGFQSGTTVTIAPSGTPTDGASYYQIGAVHIMTASAAVQTPMYGFRQTPIDPSQRIELDNGRVVKNRLGSRRAQIMGNVAVAHADDFEQVFRTDGPQVLDASNSRYPDLRWVVEWLGREHTRSIPNPARDEIEFTFRRVD